MIAFDADVLIYAAIPGHDLGRRVLALLPEAAGDERTASSAIGSVLLLPEVLSKPVRDEAEQAVHGLMALLGRLDLRPVDHATAMLAASLGASYRLRAADAVHLATAVNAGADVFVTNNHRDFPRSIGEIDVAYPGDLPERG